MQILIEYLEVYFTISKVSKNACNVQLNVSKRNVFNLSYKYLCQCIITIFIPQLRSDHAENLLPCDSLFWEFLVSFIQYFILMASHSKTILTISFKYYRAFLSSVLKTRVRILSLILRCRGELVKVFYHLDILCCLHRISFHGTLVANTCTIYKLLI